MGQSEVYKVLESLGETEWLTTGEIAIKLNNVPHRVSTTIKRMRDYGEVESVKSNSGGQNPQFKHRLTWRGRQ